MTININRKFKWNRVGLILVVFVCCSSGMVALVGDNDDVSSRPKSLSHPVSQAENMRELLLEEDETLGK